MALVPTALPAVEPVTLAEAKAHLRIDTSDDDVLVQSLVVTSRLHIEAALGLALIGQDWTWTLDRWPSGGVLELPLRPVQSIGFVRVLADDGTPATVPETAYLLDGAGEPPRLVRRPGMVWPQPGRAAAGIEIGFTAGYGATGSAVPAPIRQALLVLVAHWYENREPVTVGEAVSPVPSMVSELLSPYRGRRL